MNNKTKIIKFRTHSCAKNRDTAKLTIKVEFTADIMKPEFHPLNEAVIISDVKDYEVLPDESTEDYQLHITIKRYPWVESDLIIERSQTSEILFISAL